MPPFDNSNASQDNNEQQGGAGLPTPLDFVNNIKPAPVKPSVIQQFVSKSKAPTQAEKKEAAKSYSKLQEDVKAEEKKRNAQSSTAVPQYIAPAPPAPTTANVLAPENITAPKPTIKLDNPLIAAQQEELKQAKVQHILDANPVVNGFSLPIVVSEEDKATLSPEELKKKDAAAQIQFKSLEALDYLNKNANNPDVIEANKVLPNATPIAKKKYIETVLSNKDKVSTLEAQETAANMPDKMFHGIINMPQLMTQNRGKVVSENMGLGGDIDAINQEVKDYMNSPQFKVDYIKKQNEDKSLNPQLVAEQVLNEKATQFAGAPTLLQQKASSLAKAVAPYGGQVIGNIITEGSRGLGSVIGLALSTLNASGSYIKKAVSDDASLSFRNEFVDANKDTENYLDRAIPKFRYEGEGKMQSTINDLIGTISNLTAGAEVTKGLGLFGKIIGPRMESAVNRLFKTNYIPKQTEAFRTAQNALNSIAGSSTNEVKFARSADNFINTLLTIGAPTLNQQVDKYIQYGFSKDQAYDMAIKSTFLMSATLTATGALQPAEQTMVDKIVAAPILSKIAKGGAKMSAEMYAYNQLQKAYDLKNAQQGAETNDKLKDAVKQINAEEPLEHVVNDFILGSAFAGLHNIGTSASTTQAQGLYEAIRNPEEFNILLTKQIENGALAKENGEQIKSFVKIIAPKVNEIISKNTEDFNSGVAKHQIDPASAVRMAIEATKAEESSAKINEIDKAFRSTVITTINNEGKEVKKILYRHSDGLDYEKPETDIVAKRSALISERENALDRLRRMQAGMDVSNRVISGNEMAAYAEKFSPDERLKQGQSTKIADNAPYNVQYVDISKYSSDPEVAEEMGRLMDMKALGLKLPEFSPMPPVISENGEIIDGKKNIARRLYMGAKYMEVAKPMDINDVKEVINNSTQTNVAELKPNLDGLDKDEAKIAVEVSKVFTDKIEGDDYYPAYNAAAKDLIERNYSRADAINMLQRISDGSISPAMGDAIYNEAFKELNKTETNDSKNNTGVPSEIGAGEKLVETEFNKGAGKEEIINGRVLQTPESRQAKNVEINRAAIEENTSAEVEKLKQASVEDETGQTFNLDGTVYSDGGLIVPVVSTDRMPLEDITPEAIAEFVEKNKASIGGETVKVGIYKFPNSNDGSIDISIVAPRNMREKAIEFGRKSGQESLFDLDSGENIKTGATGEKPVKYTPEQNRQIARDFANGETPATTNAEFLRRQIQDDVDFAQASLADTGIKFELHDTPEDFIKATGQSKGDIGLFDSGDGTIHINLDAIKTNNDWNVIWHEASHPVMNIIRNTDRAMYDKIANGFKELAKTNSAIAREFDVAKKLGQADSEESQLDEAIVETIAKIANGEISIDNVNAGFKQTVIDFINKIADMLGFERIASTDKKEFLDKAKAISDALKQGQNISEIVGESNVKEFENKIENGEIEPMQLKKPQPSLFKTLEFKKEYPLSFVKPEDAFDIERLVDDIIAKKQKVWFWVADQLGKGHYYDAVIGDKHYLDAGPSFALDPKNREKGIIWASGMKDQALMNNINQSDYVFIISGSPERSKLFNKQVFDLFTKRIGDYKTFKKEVLAAKPTTKMRQVLEAHDSWESLKEDSSTDNTKKKIIGTGRKKFLNALLDAQTTPKAKAYKVYEQRNAFVDVNDLRDGFYKENNFDLNDVMLVLKPEGVGGESSHSTYERDILGKVIGVPDKKINAYDIMPEDVIKKNLNKKDFGDSQKSQAIAPYGSGIKNISKINIELEKGVESPKVQKKRSAGETEGGISKADEKHLTEGQNDDYLFFHYGKIKGEAIDAKKGKRQAYTMDKRRNTTNYYYTKTSDREGVVGGDAHVVSVPKNEVYNFNKDVLNLYDEAEANFYKDNPNGAFGAPQQMDYMLPLIEKAGYKMVIARHGDMHFRAETMTPLEFNKNLTKQIREDKSFNLKDAITETEAQIDTKLSNAANKADAVKSGLNSKYYSKNWTAKKAVADPVLRKAIGEELASKYEDMVQRYASGERKTTMQYKRSESEIEGKNGAGKAQEPATKKEKKSVKEQIKDALLAGQMNQGRKMAKELSSQSEAYESKVKKLTDDIKKAKMLGKTNEVKALEVQKEKLQASYEKALEKEKAAAQEVGEKLGVKAGKMEVALNSDEVKYQVENILANGDVPAVVAKALIKKFADVGTSEAKATEFLDYVDKVMANANAIQEIADANKVRDSIENKAKSKTQAANMSQTAKSFVKIDPKNVEDIAKYKEIADKLNATLAKPKIILEEGSPVVMNAEHEISMKEVDDYIESQMEYADKVQQERFNRKYEELVNDGIIDPSVMSLDDMKSIIEAIEGGTATDEQLKAIESEEKKKALAEVVKYQMMGFNDAVEQLPKKLISDASNEVLSNISKIKIDKLTSKQLIHLNSVINNFIANGSLAGAGALSELSKLQSELPSLIKDINASRASGESKPTVIGNKNIIDYIRNGFASISVVNKILFQVDKLASEVKRVSGIQGIIDGHSRAQSKQAEANKGYQELVESLGEEVNKPINRARQFMASFVIQQIDGNAIESKEEFDRLKSIAKQNYENHLASEDETHKLWGKEGEKAYNEILSTANNVKEVWDNLSKAENGEENKKVIEYWINVNKATEKAVQEDAEMYNNKIIPLYSNYTAYSPVTLFGKRGVVSESDKGFSSPYNPTKINIRPSGTKESRIKRTTLQSNQGYDMDFSAVQSQKHFETLLDIERSKSLMKAKMFFDMPEAEEIYGSKTTVDNMYDRVKAAVDAQSGVGNAFASTPAGKAFYAAVSHATKLALSSVKQIGLQYPSVAARTIINTGLPLYMRALDISMKHGLDIPIFKEFAIATRGLTHGGTTRDVKHTFVEKSKLRDENAGILKKYSQKTADAILAKAKSLDEFSNYYMKPLEVSDVAAAKHAWLSYYMTSLVDQGMPIDNIDWANLTGEAVNKKAAAYAEQMVSTTQASNNNSEVGTLYKSPIIKLIAPFSSFSTNMKFAQTAAVRSMFGKTGEARKQGIKEMSGIVAEAAMFNFIKRIIELGVGSAAAYSLSNLGMFKTQEEKEKVSKQNDFWADVAKNSVADIALGGTGAITENAGKELSNYAYQKVVDDHDAQLYYMPNKKEYDNQALYLFDFMGQAGGTFKMGYEIGKLGQQVFQGTKKYNIKGGFKPITVDVKMSEDEMKAKITALAIMSLHYSGALREQMAVQYARKLNQQTNREIERTSGKKQITIKRTN